MSTHFLQKCAIQHDSTSRYALIESDMEEKATCSNIFKELDALLQRLSKSIQNRICDRGVTVTVTVT